MSPGDRLPDLMRSLDLGAMVAYGAATWDWHRLHFDPDRAQRAGLDAPVVDGQMLGALIAEQVLSSFSPNARLTALSFRNRAPVLAGASVVCESTCVTDDGATITFDHVVRAGDDVVATGTSELRR